eukprot:3372354-Prymnesium_polylepis.1
MRTLLAASGRRRSRTPCCRSERGTPLVTGTSCLWRSPRSTKSVLIPKRSVRLCPTPHANDAHFLDSSIARHAQCHFMSMLWFRALGEYEYAIRVDEDVCLTRLPARALFADLMADYYRP